MPDVSPSIDRLAFEKQEDSMTLFFLTQMAHFVNAITRAGAIYPQMLLSPEDAAAKRAAMEQGGMQNG
jgi:hypothetical protein